MKTFESRLYVTARDGGESLNAGLVLIFAVACGITVANLYWAQPLLDTIAGAFHTTTATAGLIVTATQIGYALGLIFIVPLGDLFERRRLILAIMLLVAAASLVAAFSPSIRFFTAASLVIGLTSVVAQILVPFAASLAKDHERGKVVGQVMSGLLLGILLARTLAGFISTLASWRAVFGVAALLVLLQTVAFVKYLPPYRVGLKIRYPDLLASLWHLIRAEKTLRIRSFYGALVFADFSILWTSLTFLLAGPNYHYSDAIIGLFGLVGAAGACSANIAGRLADKGLSARSTMFFLLLNAAAFLLMIPGRHSLMPLIAGIVLLDAGVQGTHITNQSEIYKLNAQARSRITTVYMASFFIGGAIGSALSAMVYAAGGWNGVALLGLGDSLLAILFWVVDQTLFRETSVNP